MNRAFLLVFLTGCMSQSTFAKKFVDTYCDAYLYCDTSERPCPVRLEDETRYKACDFDANLARECLDGPFTCNDEVDRFEVIVAPAACSQVCGGVE